MISGKYGGRPTARAGFSAVSLSHSHRASVQCKPLEGYGTSLCGNATAGLAVCKIASEAGVKMAHG